MSLFVLQHNSTRNLNDIGTTRVKGWNEKLFLIDNLVITEAIELIVDVCFSSISFHSKQGLEIHVPVASNKESKKYNNDSVKKERNISFDSDCNK